MVLSACASPTSALKVDEKEPLALIIVSTLAADIPIKIRTSILLFAKFSITGAKHRDGYQLCVDLINHAVGLFGQPVELIVSENQSNADTTIAQHENFYQR
jgi:branched-chain amino acid transport system substrate-binding protein